MLVYARQSFQTLKTMRVYKGCHAISKTPQYNGSQLPQKTKTHV